MQEEDDSDAVVASGRVELSSPIYCGKKWGDIVSSSYVVGTSKGMKNVLVLTTVEPLQGVTKDHGKKNPPVVDQMIGANTTKTKSS